MNTPVPAPQRASAAKRWSVEVTSRAQEPLEIRAGRNGVAPGGGPDGSISPVEYLLIAAASCLALSCRRVLARRGRRDLTFDVHVTGEKAHDPPSRLARLEARIDFPDSISGEDAARAVAEAEEICTVTRTLLTPPQVLVSARRTIGP
jgi:uncharacterized OsmC-like protein